MKLNIHRYPQNKIKFTEYGLKIAEVLHKEYKGIDVDKKFGGVGINGAIYGSLFGNSLSDFLAGLGAYNWLSALEITIGCLIVVPFVWMYYKL